MPVVKSLDVQLGDVNLANLEQLKIMNISSLPVRYTDKFYRDLVENTPKEYLKFAFWNGFAVGAVCSRIETHEKKGFNKLYIMTISILPAYRRRGIGRTLLNHILDAAMKDDRILDVYLHVQTSNDDAKEFYIANGFENIDTILNYYKRIEPPDCHVLKKILKPM